MVLRTATTLDRLRDVLSLTAADRRIQTYFTHDPEHRSPLAPGLEAAMADLGAPLLPWTEATSTSFDLALAASENDLLADLNAPVLLVPHGAGQQKYHPNTKVVSGMNPDRLVVGGQVVPAAIGLPHRTQLDRLAQLCPPAAARGVVVGDPALARMHASLFRAGHLRAAFSTPEKQLVVVASTFEPDSLLGRLPELPELLAGALPLDEYQVLVVLHPGVWAAHGPWQVRAWLAQAAAYGVQVLAPNDGWQAALLAASVVISDHGSLALYAAALDKPVLLVSSDTAVTVPDSATALLAENAPAWDADRPPRDQIEAVIAQHVPGVHGPIVKLLNTDDCAPLLRRLIYQLLRLDEPPAPAMFAPVLAPSLPQQAVPASVVGATIRTDGIQLERYADLGHGEPRQGLEYRHLTADLRTASWAQAASANVIITAPAPLTRAWPARANEELARWPQAAMVVTVVDDTSCAIWSGGQMTVLRADDQLDPIALASLAYVRLSAQGQIPAEDTLHLGRRTISVAAAGH